MADGKIDVTISAMVPEHSMLPKGEEEKVLTALGLKRENLPKIKVTDPQCKSLDAKVGEIVRIKRKDTCENTAYRLVVK